LSSRLESEVTVIIAILTVANIFKDTLPLMCFFTATQEEKGNCQEKA
jgi:hypothetical protein